MLYIIANDSYALGKAIISEITDSNVEIIWLNSDYKNRVEALFSKVLFILDLPWLWNFSHANRKKMRKIRKEDTVLVWDIQRPALLRSIASLIKSNKRYVWIWNLFPKEHAEDLLRIKKRFQVYTFDSGDSEKYGIRYKPQVCYNVSSYPCYRRGGEKTSDLYFVGANKGRYPKLLEMYNYLTPKGIVCDFNIVADDDVKAEFISMDISFADNIRHISETRCLLDITQEGQMGLTIRALEAFCCCKKLITNNKSIIESPIYSKENIFILGFDSFEELVDFIQSDYLKPSNYQDIKEQFMINNWIRDFF